jgi:predicted nucleic acid-binding protein
MLKIYLDTCCYNRPFDDLSQAAVFEELNAISYIKFLVRYGNIMLVHSYVLEYEINRNPYDFKRIDINNFLRFAREFVTIDNTETLARISMPIMKTGIKETDALHIAAALFSQCDYFITTDKRVLKFKSDDIIITDPITFLNNWRKENGNK